MIEFNSVRVQEAGGKRGERELKKRRGGSHFTSSPIAGASAGFRKASTPEVNNQNMGGSSTSQLRVTEEVGGRDHLAQLLLRGKK